MKIGLKLPHSGPFAFPENIRAFALEAERLGYESLWAHDHIHRSAAECEHHFAIGSIEAWETWKTPLLPLHYESVSTLLYLAGITSRVLLGTSCVVLPLRNPVVLAKETACLDQFSNGRLILGVAIGGGVYAPGELGAVGSLHFLGKRGAVTDEWIDVIRGVWREPKFSYEGRFITVKEAEVYPKPLQQPAPPILVGGFRDVAHKRGAERGDGWLAISAQPPELERAKANMRAMAAQAGRDPERIMLGSEHWLSIDRDKSRAEERAAATMASLGGYLRSRGDRDSTRVGQVAERHFFGDPDTILAKIMRYKEAGVDHLILRVIAREFDEVLEELHMFKETVGERLPA